MGSKEKMNSFLSQYDEHAGLSADTSDARERVLDLLDKDSFVELGSQVLTLAPNKSGRAAVAGEGVISG